MLHGPAGSVRKESPGTLQQYFSCLWKGWWLAEKSTDLGGIIFRKQRAAVLKEIKIVPTRGQQKGVKAGAGHTL